MTTLEEALARIKVLRAKKPLSLEEKTELRYLLDLLEVYELLDKGRRHHVLISGKTKLLRYLQSLIWTSVAAGLILLILLFWRIS